MLGMRQQKVWFLALKLQQEPLISEPKLPWDHVSGVFTARYHKSDGRGHHLTARLPLVRDVRYAKP